MKLLLSKGVTNPSGRSFNVSWPEFKDLVETYNVPRLTETSDEKRSAPWFSPAEYKDNYRLRENIISRPWAMVADLDEISDTKAVLKVLSKYEYVAWTTWNSTTEEPRWRIVLPIEGGIDVERFGALTDKILSPIGKAAKIDGRTRMPEQLWFLPWHKKTQHKTHRIWTNKGEWIKASNTIRLDFTNVKLAHKPEEIGKGERNQTLVVRLTETDALRCATIDELMEIALEWNNRLREPMKRKEVLDVVRKKWKWMQRGEGIVRRAEAWKGHLDPDDMPDIGVGLMSDTVKTAKLPPSLVGDFLYPGATMISAKMKEGKSYLAMQLALAVATQTPFLKSVKHPGFSVKAKRKVVIIAGEDTAGGISNRFLGSIAAGHLPLIESPDDVKLIFNDDLDNIKKKMSKIPGLALFEALVDRWYRQGYRIIAIDPLRVLEAALGIDEYPGTARTTNVHARDFQTMRYYTKVAQEYEDLCILVSMHHGKNKRDHDATDPGDMIAGTTGFGAGAITTISLLPIPEQLEAEEDVKEGRSPKRRELYLHGRYTREQRMLIEQDVSTGVWQALGNVQDEMMSIDRQKYFDAMLALDGTQKWLSAEEIAKHAKARAGTVHKVLNRARRAGNTYLGWKLMVKRGVGGGYRLSASGNESGVRRKEK